ncbi:putative DNA polymerase III, delta prime subunit [Nitrospina gracilis 3/211]|uniref:DNA polymerase III subunit delta' n=1 Tax=Nitrospina gracilis (strain 3/211) TaxID=1266370 RepID=M1Z1H5_NITG3|nr:MULTISPECIES: DNA polymerase III subunit delta' [Nitrospina]MCF8724665.1 DNA polymerase-3 subunit delta' [Nitrospina sp. Nb-3]CCQ91848.1 putative DNA polymerase III, delta prime subunit [Nitrospina gracilis 3/211]
MSFETILGQGQAKHIIGRALEQGTVAHAYLYFGPESVGKKRTALEFAKALNCAESGPHDACGDCAPCRKIHLGQHPDVFLLEPTKKASSRDTSISIDEIRDLQKKLGFTPYEGRYKVAVVDGVEKMNLQACNAFLKTLEEPPAATVLILVTANPYQMLPTIISRCQGVRFHPLPQEALRAILESHPDAEGMLDEEIELRVLRSQGQVARALAEDVAEIARYREELLALLSQLSFRRMDLLFAWCRETGRGHDLPQIKKILEELLGLLRDVALLQAGCGTESLNNRDLAGRLGPLAQAKPRSAVLHMMESVFRTRNLLERNANVQLTLENMLMQFCEAA